jgi:hypothetical protein
VRRRLGALQPDRITGAQVQFHGGPVEFVGNIVILIVAATEAAVGVGRMQRRIGFRGAVGANSGGKQCLRVWAIESGKQPRSLCCRRGQVESGGCRWPVQHPQFAVPVRQDRPHRPAVAVHLVMRHARLRLALGHRHRHQEIKLPARLVEDVRNPVSRFGYRASPSESAGDEARL